MDHFQEHQIKAGLSEQSGDVSLALHDAWGQAALRCYQPWGEDAGVSEVFLSVRELRGLARIANEVADRLEAVTPV